MTPAARVGSLAAQPTDGHSDRWEVGGAQLDGKLLLIHGNYGPNTGPIDVLGLNPTSKAISTLLAQTPTEELWTFRTDHNGALWAGSIDPVYAPRGPDDGFIVTNQGGTWRTIPCQATGGAEVGRAVHIFDVLPPTVTDPSIYACGSRFITGQPPGTENERVAAFIWRAANVAAAEAGEWTEVVADYSYTDQLHRFYGMGRIGDRVIAGASSPGKSGVGDGAHTWGYWHGSGTSFTRVARPIGSMGIFYPPALGATRFAVDAAVYEWDGTGIVDVETEYAADMLRPLLFTDDDMLYVNDQWNLCSAADGLIGSLPGTGQNYRGVRSPSDGKVYLSDKSHIYRCDTAV